MSLSADLSRLQGGGGEREAALASLEKQLMCPICLEIFNKPVVILPCQHNLCRKCANELYQPSLFQARTTMMVNSGRFRCPSCRHEVVLDRHGVYGLQRNLLVENIIDVYKQEVSAVPSSGGVFSSSPAPLPPPLPAGVRCSDHEAEKVNIYCLTCQVPTCSLCKVFGAHQTCQVAPLTDVYQQRKDELNEELRAVGTFNNKVQSLIDGLEETCRTIEDNCRTQKQTVCDKFSRMFSILQERQKAMAQQISDEQDEKTAHVLALARCYGDRVEANNKLVESARSSMEEPDSAAFIQNSRELIEKVRTAGAACEYEPLDAGYENLRRYRLNFSRQEKALRSIQFLTENVPEEPEVDPEPEKPREALIQNHAEQTQSEAVPVQSSVEPGSERIRPPGEPVQIPPAGPGPIGDSVDAAEDATLPETEVQTWSTVRPGGPKEQEEEQEQEEDRCAAPETVKEGNLCEEQDGMSTQQAVTLIFYLLAFLLILQRVWASIGCFICT
ncbi:tripartite motif containing 101 [Salarias fasciatus]|uniref:tripartite motif containing 101 n=1 Tax=Salarias fasciatus TaxID=181472 RepID=UPI0011768D3D|nr:tripartite motif-containing protein 54-like [Salarias fasciatus]